MADKTTDTDTEKEGAADEKGKAKSVSATKPIIAPDGHVVLSQEDIDARDQ